MWQFMYLYGLEALQLLHMHSDGAEAKRYFKANMESMFSESIKLLLLQQNTKASYALVDCGYLENKSQAETVFSEILFHM
jgi:hypothetical protein